MKGPQSTTSMKLERPEIVSSSSMLNAPEALSASSLSRKVTLLTPSQMMASSVSPL